jgi:BirA family biotin operon repressor/biotin-[acetyl-CoA-carboxylase] ligase
MAKNMVKSGSLAHGSIVITDFQESGRGQQGNVWVSEKGKNLLFTIVLRGMNIAPNQQYLLNVATSLAIQKTLSTFLKGCDVAIKWPNDIYVNDRKICGILIETIISNGQLESIFCGIGLNVNQRHFSLNSATSVNIESGSDFERDVILEHLIMELEACLATITKDVPKLLEDYHANLRWIGETRTFLVDGNLLEGEIQGINEQGKLILKVFDEIRHFGLKEITFLH